MTTNRRGALSFPRPAILALSLAAACSSDFDPVLAPVPEEPTEATLADFVSGDIQDPAAFDLLGGVAVRTDLTSEWDFIFAIPPGGSPQLRPRGQILGEESDAGLLRASEPFEAIEEAPEGGYARASAVRVGIGDVLFAVSRRDPAFGTLRCRHFAKLEVLDIDPAAGTLTFRHLINPNCERRTLVPGAEE